MSNSSQLPRVLGFWIAVALVVGTVIGSGVFKKPADVARSLTECGLILAAWVLVGVLTLLGALALAEVATLLPRAGGNYVFLKESYGEWAGFLWGWVEFWIIRSASIAALTTVFTETMHDLVRDAWASSPEEPLLTYWQRQSVAVGVIVFLTWVSARGARLGGRLQVAITAVKVLTLVSIAVMPLMLWFVLPGRSVEARVENLQPIWPTDWSEVNWSKFGGAMVGVLWAYHGWMNLAPMAGEISRPGRNLPLAFLLGTGIVMLLYVSANVAYHLVIPHSVIAGLPKERTVAVEFFVRVVGPTGLMLASLAVMASTFGALNGNLLVGPRLLYAMGLDGLAPRPLGTLHAQHQTPYLAHWVLSGWSIGLMAGVGLLLHFGYVQRDRDPFDLLTNYCIFGATAFETLGVASIFVLRRRNPPGKVDLPYRCPLYPWVPIVYVAVMGAVLVNMFASNPHEAFAGLGFMVLGALVYAVVFGMRKRT
jgi:amino acid transporter